MRRRAMIVAGLLASMPVTAMAKTKPAWKTILDGKSLNGWTQTGEANWRIEAGAAMADKGKGGFLVSQEDYGDVEIRAELWVSDDANSGIFIRCENPAVIGTTSGYEVNIFDTRPDPTYGTGAIVNVAKVSPMPKAGGRWSVIEIIAKGDRFDVTFNDRHTVTDAHDAKHPRGRIALQYGQGVVKFRKVQVRPV